MDPVVVGEEAASGARESAGAAQSASGPINAGLGGDRRQRTAAYTTLRALVRGDGDAAASATQRVDVAVACVGALVNVLCADASSVDAKEWQLAASVLAELMTMDLVRVCAEYWRHERYVHIWTAASAYGAAFEKELGALSREDALTVACCNVLPLCTWARGTDAGLDYASRDGHRCGFLDGNIFPNFMAHNKIFTGSVVSDEYLEKLFMLSLEILQDPQDTSELTLGGIGTVLAWGLSGRPAMTATLIKAGLIEALVTTLHRTTPAEWVSWKSATGILAAGVLHLGWSLSTMELPGMSKIQVLLEKGLIDVFLATLRAFEDQGVAKIEEANVVGVWASVCVMTTMDLTASEAEPILRLLREMPSTLRFVLDHSLGHIRDVGMSSGASCSAVCALAFGASTLCLAPSEDSLMFLTEHRLAASEAARSRQGRRRWKLSVLAGDDRFRGARSSRLLLWRDCSVHPIPAAFLYPCHRASYNFGCE